MKWFSLASTSCPPYLFSMGRRAFRSALSFRRNCRAVPVMAAARFLCPAPRDHSFCSHFDPQDAITASHKPSVCQPPAKCQGSTQIGNLRRRRMRLRRRQSAIGNSKAQTKTTPPLPQKGEKKQKKRPNIKTANGSRRADVQKGKGI